MSFVGKHNELILSDSVSFSSHHRSKLPLLYKNITSQSTDKLGITFANLYSSSSSSQTQTNFQLFKAPIATRYKEYLDSSNEEKPLRASETHSLSSHLVVKAQASPPPRSKHLPLHLQSLSVESSKETMTIAHPKPGVRQLDARLQRTESSFHPYDRGVKRDLLSHKNKLIRSKRAV